MTSHQDPNQSVMLTDNFPAKAFLLITHLSETDPKVSSFSTDGTKFEIYDQSIFAQKYLPQYFKHSNYGSFVRQLNLYGFTSYRLENNSQVVVWSHDSFRQDRKDLIKEIKRTKKTKRYKPPQSHVHINSRNPSPPSVLEVRVGGPSPYECCPSGEDVSSNGHIYAQSAYKLSKKGSGLDKTWLESEFAHLKQQNKSLGQKLDTLLKITLQMSAVSYEAVQLGEKRRKTNPLQSSDPLIPVKASIHIHHNGLRPICEEQKLSYGDDCSIDPVPYRGNRKMPLAPSGGNVQIPQTTYEVGENFPLQGGRAIFHVATEGADGHDFGTREDSLRTFVDMMLTKDEQEECKEVEEHEVANSSSANPHAGETPANMNSLENGNLNSFPPETNSHGTLDDDLFEEAMHAMAPIDTGRDLFALSGDPEDDSARIYNQSEARPTDPTNLFTLTNAAVDKVDGPQPIQFTSLDIPAVQSGNVEEANVPIGVAIIAAEAELVEDNGDGNRNASNENVFQIEQDRQESKQSHRKKVLCLLAFMSVFLAMAVMWPAVAILKSRSKKMQLLSQKSKSKKLHVQGHKDSSSGDHPRFSGGYPRPNPCPEGVSNENHDDCVYHSRHGSKDHPDLGWEYRDDRDHDDEDRDDEDFGWKDGDDEEESGNGVQAENDMQESPENIEEDLSQNTTEVLRLSSNARAHIWNRGRSRSRGETISSSFHHARDNSPEINSFFVTLEGTEFICSKEGTV